MTAQIGGRMGAHSSPFGLSRIWRQIKWDLFETKDVQDAITASYVWLEDEAGHIGHVSCTDAAGVPCQCAS